MPVMIQIRDVSEATHRTMKVRAAQTGRSLSDYLRNEIDQLAARPTWEEIRARLRAEEPVDVSPEEIVRIVREDRESR